ncbi:MAG: glycine cleavage system protein GcvH [Bacteroidia bacterium]|nr:glycine cleavage system protein GcvH [Bacteroidia bacterium]
MSIPEGLLYSDDHEWIRIEGNIATVGITHFAQSELGDIVYVEIESLDQNVENGEVFGSVEAVKTVSDLLMPVSGTITEVNDKLEAEPELVNSDPYGDGWMIKIELDGEPDTAHLKNAAAYGEHIGA